MAQLMPLPLTVSCFSEIQIGFSFLVPAHLGSPGKRAVKRVCVCVCSRHSAVVVIPSHMSSVVCATYIHAGLLTVAASAGQINNAYT